MDFDQGNIIIIDTQTNTRVLQDEFAGLGDLHLTYLGADDRLQNMMPSQLRFTFLVKDKTDAKFLHLLNTSESRYKVELQILDDDDVFLYNLWEGFLLPDQFSEPYVTGPFFVSFIASDGLGRLKGSDISFFSIFGNQVSITNLITTSCLSLTGLSLPISIAPAIQNANATVRVDQLEIDTACYYDALSNDKQNNNAYDILNRLLTVLGCKIFQYKGRWYLVGINRFEEQNISFENYSIYGAYVDTTTYNRSLSPIKFLEGTATVDTLMPFKKATVTWPRKLSTSVLPEDLVYQPIANGAGWSTAMFPIPKYWDINFANAPTNYPVLLGSKDGLAPTPWVNGVWVENPGYVTLDTLATTATLAANYMKLLQVVFVDDKQTVSFKMSGTCQFTVNTTGIDYSNSVIYEISINGTIVASNKSSFTNYLYYEPELKYTGKYLDFEIEIDELDIDEPGYLDFKIYAFKSDLTPVYFQKMILHTLKFTSSVNDDETILKTRSITGTLTHELDTFHGSSISDLTNRKLLIDDAVAFTGITVDYPEILEEIPITSFVIYNPHGVGNHHRADLTFNSYQKLLDNKDIIFLKKGGVGSLIKPTNFDILDSIPGAIPPFNQGFLFDQFVLTSTPPYLIESGDEIWIQKDAYQETYTDRHYIMQSWKLYGGSESEKLTNILARLYHNQVKDFRFRINGNALGLYSPLELISFKYDGLKNWIPTALDMDLVAGKTQLTMIEPINTEVTDYVN